MWNISHGLSSRAATSGWTDTRGERRVPQAAQKGMGIMVIKVIRPREQVTSVTPQELIKYALSLKHVHVAMIGTDSLDVVKNNIALLKSFKPYDNTKLDQLRAALQPFYRNKGLGWMQSDYQDGHWA